MKLKLINDESQKIIGYENLYLDQLGGVSDHSCFEMYVDENVLKTIPNINIDDFIQVCCSKIRHGGMLILTSVDVNKVCLAYIRRNISEQDFSEYLGNSAGFFHCKLIRESVVKNGLKIDSMLINDYNFIVRGLRD